jgi:hypothetical protein
MGSSADAGIRAVTSAAGIGTPHASDPEPYVAGPLPSARVRESHGTGGSSPFWPVLRAGGRLQAWPTRRTSRRFVR